jgi:CheY-like chemotaxis protein
MTNSRESITILMADDDPEDVMLTEKAFKTSGLINDFRSVADGQELLDYLLHLGAYADAASAPRPGLILLDLNMPVIDGRAALKAIKEHPELRRIPVVVLTTSRTETDIVRSYDTGANSYITKPVTFEGLVEAMKQIERYWFDLVAIPES